MITTQIESFAVALPELMRIFPHHWRELALFQNRMPLAPQFHEYMRRERSGSLFLATVRVDGEIAGYYTAQVAAGFHYGSTLTGTMDMVYITEEHRNKGLIVPLMRRVEREMQRRQVQVWYAGYKSHNPMQLDRILPRFGFIPADTYMAKWIGA